MKMLYSKDWDMKGPPKNGEYIVVKEDEVDMYIKKGWSTLGDLKKPKKKEAEKKAVKKAVKKASK